MCPICHCPMDVIGNKKYSCPRCRRTYRQQKGQIKECDFSRQGGKRMQGRYKDYRKRKTQRLGL